MNRALVLADFIAREHSQLSVVSGEIVHIKVNYFHLFLFIFSANFFQIISKSKWCYAYSINGEGFIPLNFIKIINGDEVVEKEINGRQQITTQVYSFTYLLGKVGTSN